MEFEYRGVVGEIAKNRIDLAATQVGGDGNTQLGKYTFFYVALITGTDFIRHKVFPSLKKT